MLLDYPYNYDFILVSANNDMPISFELFCFLLPLDQNLYGAPPSRIFGGILRSNLEHINVWVRQSLPPKKLIAHLFRYLVLGHTIIDRYTKAKQKPKSNNKTRKTAGKAENPAHQQTTLCGIEVNIK